MNDLLRRIGVDKPPSENAGWLQSVYLLVLEQIRGRSRSHIEAATADLAAVISEWQSGAQDVAAADRRLWYVGHAQCLLALLRTAIDQELPAGLEKLARGKHVTRLLTPLKGGDRTLSDLASVTALDLSYVDREVTRLAAAGAVRTEKHGRERWVTLTFAGQSLLELARRTRRGRAGTRIERTLDQLLTAVNELRDRQSAFEEQLERGRAGARVQDVAEGRRGSSAAQSLRHKADVVEEPEAERYQALPAKQQTDPNEEEDAEKKKHTLHTLAEGKVLKGTVKNITDYGAFIDLGGIDGLLHITDMSWGRVGHPSELFKVNDQIDVIVLKYDPATERVSLGHKQLVNDPWSNVSDRYPVGARMSAKVVSLTDDGAFIELDPGVEGLIHVSEMSWSKRVKHPSKILNVGDSVDAMVLGVDATARRISLGLKQVETDPWHELAEKYPVGAKIVGKVRNLTEFGAFVEVEDDIDGLIHISDMSWSKRIKHPSEVLKKGDKVEAMVLNIDAENQRLSLGLKQLATDIWDDFFTRHQVGETIEGKVVRVANFGAFVELDEGIEGLIHTSELDDTKGTEKIELTVGQNYPMKIIKLVPAERKIGLSIPSLKAGAFRTKERERAKANVRSENAKG